MVKIKQCLDTGCTKYILLEDGRTITTPNAVCTGKIWTDKDRQDYADIVRATRETIMVNKPVMQDAKAGDEVPL